MIQRRVTIDTDMNNYIDHCGRQVITARTAADQQRLIKAAIDFSVELVPIQKSELLPFYKGRFDQGRAIVGLGASVYTAGHYYANFRNLDYLQVSNVSELQRISARVEAIFVSPNELSAEFFEALYAFADLTQYMPGIAVASQTIDLCCRAAMMAIGSLYEPEDRPKINMISSSLLSGTYDEGRISVHGRGSSSRTIAEGLRNSDLLLLVTHSDGVDSFLTEDLSLCGIAERAGNLDHAVAPDCLKRQMCYRHKKSIAEALNDGRLISPGSISAKVFLYSACWGFRSESKFHNPKASIFAGVMDNDAVATLITTNEIISTTSQLPAGLIELLDNGIEAGEAVVLFNRKYAQSHLGGRLIVFGLASIKLAPAQGRQMPLALPDVPSPLRLNPISIKDVYDWMVSYLTETQGITAVERKIFLLAVAEVRKGGRLHPIFFKILSDIFLAEIWQNTCDPGRSHWSASPCANCGGPARTLSAFLGQAPFLGRAMQRCPSCGNTFDLPINAQDVEMVLTDDFEISVRQLKARPVYAFARFKSEFESSDQSKFFGMVEADDGAIDLHLEKPKDPGRYTLLVYLLWKDDLAVKAFQVQVV